MKDPLRHLIDRFPLNTGNLALIVLGRFLIASFPMGREAPTCTSQKVASNLSLAGASARLRPSLAAWNRSDSTLQRQRFRLQ
jgi:hypothetical protein